MFKSTMLREADGGTSGGANSDGESANSQPSGAASPTVAIPDEQLTRVLQPLVQSFRDKANQTNAERLAKVEEALERLAGAVPQVQPPTQAPANSGGTGAAQPAQAQGIPPGNSVLDYPEDTIKTLGLDPADKAVITAFAGAKTQADFIVRLVELKKEKTTAAPPEDGPQAGTLYGGGRQLGDAPGPVQFANSFEAYAAGWRQSRQPKS